MRLVPSIISTWVVFGWIAIDAMAALRTVVLEGQTAPLPGQIATFDDLRGPVLNNAGQIAFSSVVSIDGAAESETAIWVEDRGTLTLVARRGDPAPGTTPSRDFHSLGSFPTINAQGQVAFDARLADANGELNFLDLGVWTSASESLGIVARMGGHSPGTEIGTTFFGALNTRSLNNAGQTVLTDLLEGPDVTPANDRGLWLGGPGTLALVAREGNDAPGTEAGVKFDTLSNLNVFFHSLNNAGHTAFRATLGGPGIGTDNNSGIWYWNGTSSQLVAREGQQAPGLPDGVRIGGLESLSTLIDAGPNLNDSGQLVFFSLLAGTGVDTSNGNGLWLRDGDDLRIVARAGDPAPGTPASVDFAMAGSRSVINANAEIAFVGSLQGPGVDMNTNAGGIWAGTPDSLRLVIRSGDPAPGTPDGTVFSNSNFSSTNIILNALGQTAFYAELSGPGVTNDNNGGIWAETRGHVLTLIAREGDQIEVAPGELRTITGLNGLQFTGRFNSSGNQDGRRSGFNDRGQIVFEAAFLDGTAGIFVSDLVAVPEPNGMTPWLSLFAAFLLRSRSAAEFRRNLKSVA